MRALKARIRNFALAGVEKSFSVVTRPFSKAPDLETYSRRGFYLLGVMIVVVTLLLWWQGILTTPLSESNVVLRSIYNGLTQKLLLEGIPDSLVPLALFVPIVWAVILLFWKRARNWLGEVTANCFFWVLNKSIGAGEYCIEHRWFSLILILLLTAVVAVLGTLAVQQRIHARTLQNDFEYWLESVDHFIANNPITRPEPVAFKRVPAWRREFATILAQNDGTRHPAICLQEILNDLYLDKSDRTWIQTLQLKVEGLRQISDKCALADSKRAKPESIRARALMNLVMARIYTRLADDPNDQSYSDYRHLVQALNLFSTVEKLDYGKADYGKRYRADAYNGQGTIYSNALTAYMSKEPPKPERLANLRLLCGNPSQCVLKSLAAYQSAGQGWEPCSYQRKRERNNTSDLLTRIGLHYDELSKSVNAPWMSSRLSLANQIEQYIAGLMACNKEEPFLPTYVITAAQGFAVSANLRRLDGVSGEAQLIASGRYLRLANSFEPKNVPDWDYVYFCSAVNGHLVDSVFEKAITSGSDGLPNADLVVQMMRQKCR